MDAEEFEAEMEKTQDADALSRVSRKGEITLRERYRRAMQYRKVDSIPNFEFGYWTGLLDEWHKQGLPDTVNDEASAYAFFGIENWKTAPVRLALMPAFEQETIEETDEYLTYRDGTGAVCQVNKEGHRSIPHYIDFKLKTRKDWEEYRERLDPQDPKRIPENWPELAEAYSQRDFPLAVPVGSMIGWLRNWIGFENIAMMVYDDPELLEEMVEHLCVLVCTQLEKVLPDVEFDFGSGWEDICFNSGPIVGADFMRNVVGPRYRRIADLLRQHGCWVCWTDCDGNLTPIADVFVENGYNCFFPVEVNGGTDPLALRESFGRKALFQGGYCKMRLREGPEAIDRELLRLKPVVEDGGFIPGVDHRVPADVKLADYMYYQKRKREIYNVGGTPRYDESKVGLVGGRVEIPKL
jgi:hypothetical protein